MPLAFHLSLKKLRKQALFEIGLTLE